MLKSEKVSGVFNYFLNTADILKMNTLDYRLYNTNLYT